MHDPPDQSRSPGSDPAFVAASGRALFACTIALPLPQQQRRVDGPATNPWAVMQGSPALSRWWGFAAVAHTPRDCFSGSWCMLCAGRREQNEWQALLQLDTRDRAACRPPHPIGGAAPPAPTRPRGAGPSRRPSACSWAPFHVGDVQPGKCSEASWSVLGPDDAVTKTRPFWAWVWAWASSLERRGRPRSHPTPS